MPEIRVDVGDVRGKGQEFQRKRGELEALVSSAKALMGALQSTFTGIRAQRIFSEWEGMQPGLTNAITTLERAGEFLMRAAADFEVADTSF